MNQPTTYNMKTFYTVWIGQLVSTIGSGLTAFALGVWIYTTTGSATLFALSLLAMSLPNLLLSPLAGALADRMDRRVLMILSDTTAGLSSLAIAFLFWFDLLTVWHIYIAVAVNAAANAFQYPAYTAATTLIVPKEKLGNASGMVQIGEAVSQLLAPAIAGVLFVTVGLGGVLAVDFATFGIAILTLAIVRFPQPKPSSDDAQQASFWQDFTYGWRYIVKRPGLLGLLLYFAAINLVTGMLGPLMTPMLLDLASADVVGYVGSIVGVGMLVGTVVMSAWGGPQRRVLGILGSGIVTGIFLAGLGLQPSPWWIAGSGFLSMLVLPVMNGSSQALWQTKVAPDVQGRVFSVRRMIAWSTTPIAMLTAGPLADRLFEPLMAADGPLASSVGQLIGTGPGRGVGLFFIVIGLTTVLISILAYLHPRLRLVEDELPDVITDTAAATTAETGPAVVGTA
ncbi:MAG: MFS transporter [Anaerolineales bacterium]|nr:MFS transporter [Anaerolineales bacterium]